jgi:hypothetical protein
MREVHVLQDFEEERPGNRVERLGDINFEQDARMLPSVQPTTVQLDRAEGVMNSPSFDERRLVGPDK